MAEEEWLALEAPGHLSEVPSKCPQNILGEVHRREIEYNGGGREQRAGDDPG